VAREDRAMRKSLLVTIAVPLVCLLVAASSPRKVMDWPELLDRPHAKADRTIRYGADPLEVADLWLPRRAGPHPTVLMVHGGCWRTEIADRTVMDWIAEDLRRRGIAVWNVEYRGVDRPGGGYPGTFRDVAAAADALRGAATEYDLAIDRIVVVGHSAGGHLGLWLAARPGLPAASPLRVADPLPISAAISLGGLPDLASAHTPPGDACGAETIEQLTGPATSARPDVYADTSPAALPPPAAAITLVNGMRDDTAPPSFATAYASKMRAKGKAVTIVTVPDEGHVELIAPGTAAWRRIAAAIEQAFAR
jgi:acetyl esterase/lipase